MVDTDILSWHEVKTDLLRRLDTVNKSLHTATGDDILRLQGKAQTLTDLLNLPQTLILQREKVKP